MGKSPGLVPSRDASIDHAIWQSVMELPLRPDEELICRARSIHQRISSRYQTAWEASGFKNGYFIWMCLAELRKARDACLFYCPELKDRAFITDIPEWVSVQLAAYAVQIEGVVNTFGAPATKTRTPQSWDGKAPPKQSPTRSDITKSAGAVMRALTMTSDGWNGLPEAFSFIVEGAIVHAGDILKLKTDKIAMIMRECELKNASFLKTSPSTRSGALNADTADGDALAELSGVKRRIRKQRKMRGAISSKSAKPRVT